VVAFYNLGVALQQLGEARKAADAFEQAIELMPEFPEAHCNLGLAYVDMGMYEEGIAAYRRAVQLRPDFPEALANLSKPLVDLRRFDEAAEVLRQAIALRPDYSVAMENYAAVLRLSGDAISALALCEQILSVDPENAKARVDQINIRRTLCDWEPYWDDVLTLKRKADSAEPFIFMNSGALASEQLVCARSWAARHAQPPGFSHPPPHERKKLRIGYLSADFRRHATAYLVAELFERHDRERFEIIGYSYGYEDDSDERKRLIKSFDRFVDLEKVSHTKAAETIFKDGVDILIDLKGYTGGTRTEILAPRPAPIQVSYLGYPATMGADFIDYLISDAIITPMDHQPFYSERLALLPHTYQPNDTRRRISEAGFARADFGLPEQGFVFCSFNGAYKFNPPIFDVWMRLLRQTPSSVLWLLGISPQVEANLAREAAARGVDPARVVFSPALPISDHLARHALADLFLDTLPINAHTTASDALWAGLPVLTVLGDCFAGRVAASLLNAVGLSDMIARSLADYEAMALAFARQPQRLAEVKARLKANLATSPLFAIDLYTRHLEAAYVRMWEIHKSGASPQAFAVEP
jgi:predicted O-linked N-acetylglucosamine transferase (SPINDLY family)